MAEYYEFEVKLPHIKPTPKRRFLLHQSATFEALHEAIQRAFRWYGDHLWAFGSSRRHLSDVADCEGEEGPLASRVKLTSYFGKRGERATKVFYTYDFGDCWEHLVTLKKVVTQEPATHWRKLLSGAHPAPPEDCRTERRAL